MTMIHPVFEAAIAAWRAGAPLRELRRRMKNYTYGRQWGDRVRCPDGRVLTEHELALQNGSTPLTNNLIRQIVKGVVGRFRHDCLTQTPLPASDSDAGRLAEIDARTLEEFLISGMAVQRVTTERRQQGCGPWTDMVSPGRFFVNAFRDPSGCDIELIGMLHDMSLTEVMMRFGGTDSAGISRLKAIYGNPQSPAAITAAAAGPDSDGDDFFTPTVRSRCRVIEVWTMEAVSTLRCHDHDRGEAFMLDASAEAAVGKENARRHAAGRTGITVCRTTSIRWRCRYFSPDGTLLHTFLSPWSHGSHPFVVKFYPLIDGEVHPFVEDIIDQQRHINRLITQMDHVLGASAKGNLLFPLGAKPRGMSWNDLRANWGRPGAVIPYVDTPTGKIPQPVSTTTANSQAAQMLDIELDMMQRVSGVSGALLGMNPTVSNASSGLYAAQADNASIALLDIFETFKSFTTARDRIIALSLPGAKLPDNLF